MNSFVMKQRCKIKGKTSNFQTTIEDYIKHLLQSIMKIVLLHTHISPLILYLFSRKSSRDGRVALVLENLLLITINPSMTSQQMVSGIHTAPIVKAKRNKSCSYYGWNDIEFCNEFFHYFYVQSDIPFNCCNRLM